MCAACIVCAGRTRFAFSFSQINFAHGTFFEMKFETLCRMQCGCQRRPLLICSHFIVSQAGVNKCTYIRDVTVTITKTTGYIVRMNGINEFHLCGAFVFRRGNQQQPVTGAVKLRCFTQKTEQWQSQCWRRLNWRQIQTLGCVCTSEFVDSNAICCGKNFILFQVVFRLDPAFVSLLFSLFFI